MLLLLACSAVVSVSALCAQPLRMEAGTGVAHSNGKELGTGTGVDIALSLGARSLPSLSLVATGSLTQFGRVTLLTSSGLRFSGMPARLIREYSVHAAVSSIAIGPEIVRTVHGIRTYAHVLGGASRVVSGGVLLRSYLSGSSLDQTLPPRPTIEERTGTVATMVIGVGLRIRLLSRLVGDLGVSRTLGGAVPWITEPVEAFIADESPRVDFRRSVSVWSWRAGVRYAP